MSENGERVGVEEVDHAAERLHHTHEHIQVHVVRLRVSSPVQRNVVDALTHGVPQVIHGDGVQHGDEERRRSHQAVDLRRLPGVLRDTPVHRGNQRVLREHVAERKQSFGQRVGPQELPIQRLLVEFVDNEFFLLGKGETVGEGLRFGIGDSDGLDPIVIARNGTNNASLPRVGGSGDGDVNHFSNDQGVHPGCKMGMKKLSRDGEILVRQLHSDALSLIN